MLFIWTSLLLFQCSEGVCNNHISKILFWWIGQHIFIIISRCFVNVFPGIVSLLSTTQIIISHIIFIATHYNRIPIKCNIFVYYTFCIVIVSSITLTPDNFFNFNNSKAIIIHNNLNNWILTNTCNNILSKILELHP